MNRVAQVAAVALLGVLAPAASAAIPQETPASSGAASILVAQGSTVTFSGQVLLRIRTGIPGYTAEQRAEQIRARMVPILSMENLRADEITVQQTRPNQDANIYVRDRLLITVDRGLAQANGDSDPGPLARQWAQHIRDILPNVSVKPNPNGA